MSTPDRCLSPSGQTIGFILAADPPATEPPQGFTVASLERSRFEALWPSGHFGNALGDPDEGEKAANIAAAFAVLDAGGQPQALAGCWPEGPGLLEIGIDVLRDARGKGLALPAVAAIARWILDQGMTPTYTVAATNIRSQRVALRCGFVPFWTVAAVRRAD
jgi:hypothetical protein